MAVVPKKYYLESISFNPATRIAKLVLLEVQSLQEVEKFVVRYHAKKPIVANDELDERIYKTIKLTNNTLEELNRNKDEQIRQLAHEIVRRLENPSLEPSWYKRKRFLEEKENQIKEVNNHVAARKEEIKNETENIIKNIHAEKLLLKKEEKCNAKLVRKCEKKSNILKNVENAKNIVVKSVFTLGIYYLFVSKKRQEHLKKVIADLNEKINKSNETINKYHSDIDRFGKDIANNKKRTELVVSKAKKKKEQLAKHYENEIASIQPLPNDSDKVEEAKYVLLKSLNLKGKKVGCYVIRNRMNGKCYVGQSKDVMKKIKQMFNGTEPINEVFIPDYNSVNRRQRENLFEVKIIECETKEELNSIEERLIEDNDSQINGYNKVGKLY